MRMYADREGVAVRRTTVRPRRDRVYIKHCVQTGPRPIAAKDAIDQSDAIHSFATVDYNPRHPGCIEERHGIVL